MDKNVNSEQALKRLKDGNLRYLNAVKMGGDISPKIRKKTAEKGQNPFAVVIACSDSRVIPEAIFDCGIGEIFVIRVAGNVVGDFELGSVEYAVSHLGCKLVAVMGHTHCGAVGAALSGDVHGRTKSLTDAILRNIGDERDSKTAAHLNAEAGVKQIRTALELPDGVKIISALYDIESGSVEFFEDN